MLARFPVATCNSVMQHCVRSGTTAVQILAGRQEGQGATHKGGGRGSYAGVDRNIRRSFQEESARSSKSSQQAFAQASARRSARSASAGLPN
eukprot:2493426-Pleurochrysis_carterae.AAC.2